MSEYTDLCCDSPAIAEAVKAYLESEIASIEPVDRPNITAIVEKSTLRITYHEQDCHRADWDMQLLGYRDGLSDCDVAVTETENRQLGPGLDTTMTGEESTF